MSVNDGEKVNAQVTNGAFVSKEVDDTKIGLLNLQDPSSANVDDVQGEINTNKTDIADHEGRITQNESDIVDHETRIGTNETEIQAIEDSVGAASGITPLDAGVKIPLIYIPDSLIGAMNYQGTWNATTNTPTLADGGVGGDKGHYYVVQVAGSTSIDGVTDWEIGDWIINNGTIWEKIDNTDKVSSFNSRTGAVLPVASDYDANQVDFDNVASGMAATNVQAAIDENDTRLDSIEGSSYVNSFNTRTGAVSPAASDYDSNQVDYDNVTSGLAATDAQGAIDEVEGRVDTLESATHVNSFNSRTGVVLPAASDYDAIQVDYDDSVTLIGEINVQGVIVNHEGRIDTLEGAGSGVTSFNTRTGAVVPVSGDYAANEITETTTKKFDIKHNRNSSVAPVVTDDSATEYQIGSHWFDKVGQVEYVCQDNSVGAAVWIIASGSGGVGSPSIFGLFNAEETSPLDDWTTSAGVLSEETTNQLNGDTSYKYIPTAVSDETESPIVVIPLRSKRKKTVMTEFVFEANEDGFRIEVRDNTNKVLGFSDVEASQNSARIIYNLTGSEISLNFAIVTAIYTASMQIVVDDIIFDDEVFRKIETIDQQYIRYNTATGYGSTSNKVPYFTNEEFNTGSNLLTIVNSSTYGLSVTAIRKCTVEMSWTSVTSGSQPTGIAKGDSIIDGATGITSLASSKILALSESPGGSYRVPSVEVELQAGESIYPSTRDGNTIIIAGTWSMNITAIATSDNVVVDDNLLYQNYQIKQAANGVTNGTGEIEFNLGTATILDTGSNYIYAEDDSGSTRTKFIANIPCTVIVSFKAGVGAGSSVSIFKNDALYSRGSSSGLASAFSEVTTTLDLDVGDYFCAEASLSVQPDIIYMDFLAKPNVQAIIIPIADPYENTYSAHIQGSANTNNLDIVTVLSSSSDFIKEVVHDSLTASWLVKWKVGHFTVPPSVLGTVEMNVSAYGRILVVDYVNTTEARILISNSGTAEDNDFHLMVQRQDADYREPQGIFIGQSVPMRVAYVSNQLASGTAAANTTATNNISVLQTLSGDSSFVSLASNQFTLNAGTYEIDAVCTSWNDTLAYVRTQPHIYNVTDSTYAINGISVTDKRSAGNAVSIPNKVAGQIVVTSAKAFELRMYSDSAITRGFGEPTTSGQPEVYAMVKITKVK